MKVWTQSFITATLVIITSLSCFFLNNYLGYQVVALILLFLVSLEAILFEIVPVLLAAVLSALIWNFFFIPPVMTFHIGTPADAMMFTMYFVIALINASLTYKIKQFEKKERDRVEKERTIKLYGNILSSLSHELRTPISTIIGAADTMKSDEFAISDQSRLELVNEIELAGVRLNRQVENLLNMSRLEAGMLKPSLDWCDVNELIYSVIHERHEFPKHRVSFNANEGLPLIRSDRGLLEQICINLVHNAFQHTPANTLISIVADVNDDECVIVIADNGLGFPEEEIPMVFQKFYRLSGSAPGGTGLGLSIVKGFVEALNGRINLENMRGGGARFEMKFPVETTKLADA